MSTALLDINVLIALLDPDHINHHDAHRWFRGHREKWAACPLTINGCVRILSHPRYSPSRPLTVAGIVALLQDFCSSPQCEFWPDALSLLDETAFRHSAFRGSAVITDVYLLALAVQRGGKLVTFDRSVPHKAVVSAAPEHLEIPIVK
jgi:uncharacterized protein